MTKILNCYKKLNESNNNITFGFEVNVDDEYKNLSQKEILELYNMTHKITFKLNNYEFIEEFMKNTGYNFENIKQIRIHSTSHFEQIYDVLDKSFTNMESFEMEYFCDERTTDDKMLKMLKSKKKLKNVIFKFYNVTKCITLQTDITKYFELVIKQCDWIEQIVFTNQFKTIKEELHIPGFLKQDYGRGGLHFSKKKL